MKAGLAVTMLLGLAGCVTSGPPVVSDFNGDSVKVQISAIGSPDASRPAANAEALRICRSGGRSRAEFASQTSMPAANPYDMSTTFTLLYLCLG